MNLNLLARRTSFPAREDIPHHFTTEHCPRVIFGGKARDPAGTSTGQPLAQHGLRFLSSPCRKLMMRAGARKLKWLQLYLRRLGQSLVNLSLLAHRTSFHARFFHKKGKTFHIIPRPIIVHESFLGEGVTKKETCRNLCWPAPCPTRLIPWTPG